MSNENMEVDSGMNNSEESDNCWRGHSMEHIYRGLNEWDLKHFPEVRHEYDHTVLFHLPVRDHTVPPTPYRSPLKWDAHHVRLPYAPQNQYVVRNDDDSEEVKDRWSLIRTALTRNIRTSYDLEEAILSYNTKYCKTWKFKGLHKLLQDNEGDTESFFTDILPRIIKLALALPELVPTAIPLLKRGATKSISFSQQQISSLLANAFLCTFPRRNAQGKRSEYRSFPDINFNRLFQSSEPNVIEKLKCICNYFRRVCRTVPTGVVTFTRRCMLDRHRIKWNTCGADFKTTKLHVSSNGTIEDNGRGLLQVDFANKYLGGGVLGRGCVQEEIRFVICPEMIVSKLITEVLDKNEALFMIGCERFSDYNGYASSFEFNGNFEDHTPYDASRRRLCNVVAIDALEFYATSDQYKEELMRRELDKAYVGYYHGLDTPAPGVATGNWGCGAFGGNKQLKALLQLMVCCVTCRPMVYFTFSDKDFRDELVEMFNVLVADGITIAQLWASLVEIRHNKVAPEQIYSFIYQWHRDIKHARLLLDDSPNFDDDHYESTKSNQIPTSSYKASNSHTSEITSSPQWGSQTSPSIPSSSFYNKTSSSSKIEMSTHSKNTCHADLIRKSRSTLLDAHDREYYRKKIDKAKINETVIGTSSLLSALDADYGVQKSDQSVDDKNEITSRYDQVEASENMFGDVNNSVCEDDKNSFCADIVRDKLKITQHESFHRQYSDDEEEIIPCTPPAVEKSLKRKACIDKKQKKITDIFSKQNPNQ